MNSEEQQQLDVLRLEIAALKARIAVLEAHGRDARPWPALPGPFEFVPQMPPTWWPDKGPTCGSNEQQQPRGQRANALQIKNGALKLRLAALGNAAGPYPAAHL